MFDFSVGDLVEVAAGPDCPDNRLPPYWCVPPTLCVVRSISIDSVLVQPYGSDVISGLWVIKQISRIRPFVPR